MESQTNRHEEEKNKIKGKLTESVRLLQHMKQLKEQAEGDKTQQERELQRLKEEMIAREKQD